MNILLTAILVSISLTAQVVSVVDGDTIKVEARIWPGLIWQGSVRVRGVDAPEIRGRCQTEKDLALAARDFVRGLVGEEVVLLDVEQGKYAGRVVASVRLADGRDLAEVLVKTGHGRPYNGGAREPWCQAGPKVGGGFTPVISRRLDKL